VSVHQLRSGNARSYAAHNRRRRPWTTDEEEKVR